jgi:hypothetical protein
VHVRLRKPLQQPHPDELRAELLTELAVLLDEDRSWVCAMCRHRLAGPCSERITPTTDAAPGGHDVPALCASDGVWVDWVEFPGCCLQVRAPLRCGAVLCLDAAFARLVVSVPLEDFFSIEVGIFGVRKGHC